MVVLTTLKQPWLLFFFFFKGINFSEILSLQKDVFWGNGENGGAGG